MVSQLLTVSKFPVLNLFWCIFVCFHSKGFLDRALQLVSAKRQSKISLLDAKKVVTTHTQNRTILQDFNSMDITANYSQASRRNVLLWVGKAIQLSQLTCISKEKKKPNRTWWVLLLVALGRLCGTCIMKIALAKMYPQICFEK